MENKPLRFRAAPEVHAAAATLQARGVDVGEMLSKHLIEQARPKPAIYEYALRMGMETRLFEAFDFDGLLVKVVTNGKGEKWAWPEGGGTREYDANPRYVLLFRIDHRGAVAASAGVIMRHGGEQVPPFAHATMRTPTGAIPSVSPDRAIYDAEVLARAAG